MSVQTLFSRVFWIATLERAIRSFATSLGAMLTASGTGILATSWGDNLSVAGMAALGSVLLAIGGGTFGKGEGPSFIGEERLKTEPAEAAAPAPRKPARRRSPRRKPATASAPSVPAPAPAPAEEQTAPAKPRG
jgi:hypothetical protein